MIIKAFEKIFRGISFRFNKHCPNSSQLGQICGLLSVFVLEVAPDFHGIFCGGG